MKYQKLILVALAGAALAAVSAPAAAQLQLRDGFYGGIAMREGNAETTGVLFGRATLAPAAPQVEEATSQQRVFGGYRWRNDLALEAGLARSESYALRPFGAGAPGGVGLTLAAPQESARSAWNVDVVGSYTFLRAFALYGRVGYAQSEFAATSPANFLTGDLRRPREGMNYGLGMRYDVTRALGLNLEYTRFGHFAFESFGNTLPENDQVRLGVQFRF